MLTRGYTIRLHIRERRTIHYVAQCVYGVASGIGSVKIGSKRISGNNCADRLTVDFRRVVQIQRNGILVSLIVKDLKLSRGIHSIRK